ncbi:MAG: adenine-specific methyltransferase EcoRI family protein [Planctomycetia bacterium]|nr:adenine-specific methyltransferase EcoRI family protein [Planctomycetia bacterium]
MTDNINMDELYTQLGDIGGAIQDHIDYLAGKVVLCNCDDPYESNFFRYFALAFNYLKLKKLITTSYVNSPVAGKQLNLLPVEGNLRQSRPYKIEITEMEDKYGDGEIDFADIEIVLRNRKGALTELKGDGDFRSEECIELLREADVVITHPPFSLFREYLAQLMEFDKKFLILGDQKALDYPEVQHLINEDLIWQDCNFWEEIWVYVNDENGTGNFLDDQRIVSVPYIWFTNIDYLKSK